MEKRNYTHVQGLPPEIKAILADGKQAAAAFLQFTDRNTADGKPGSGHDSPGYEETDKKSRCYIPFYNYERIQLKTGEAPLARRLST